MDVPWFMLSPSPVSLIQYAILSWLMWGYFSKFKLKIWKYPRFMAALDGFFTVAFFVCITDAIWVSFSLAKWLPLYPGDLWLLLGALGRDLAAVCLFGLMIADHIKSGRIQLNLEIWIWLGVCAAFQGAWFFLSPSPAYTDYTYAFRHGSSAWIIAGSWILSHFIMRIPLWIAILKTRREILC